MSNQPTDEQKITNLIQKLNRATFIINFFRKLLPKGCGDALLTTALELWNKDNPSEGPFRLPDNWIVKE